MFHPLSFLVSFANFWKNRLSPLFIPLPSGEGGNYVISSVISSSNFIDYAGFFFNSVSPDVYSSSKMKLFTLLKFSFKYECCSILLLLLLFYILLLILLLLLFY